MSDPSQIKQERELKQVRTFLLGAGISYARMEHGGDPPDAIVYRDGRSASRDRGDRVPSPG